MVYRPPFIKQLDGSKYAGLNCTMACTAMAVVRHRKGSNPPGAAPWYPTPSWLRSKTGDKIGGTTLTQADTVATKYYGVNLDVEPYIPWVTFRSRIEQGQAAILQGYYAVFKGTRHDAAPGFYGNHAVYINEVRWNRAFLRWEFLMYDPMADGRRNLPKGPQWIQESTLQKFAAELRVTSTKKAGTGKAWAAFTRDTEAVILTYNASKITPKVYSIRVNDSPIRRNPNTNGKIVYKLDKGQTFKAYQVLKTGPLYKNSRVWYGDINGTKWCHSSFLIGG